MKQDKIVIEKEWFVQVVASLLMTCAYFQEALSALWRLPILVLFVTGANMYFNAVCIGYRLKAKTLKISWCFKSERSSIMEKNPVVFFLFFLF